MPENHLTITFDPELRALLHPANRSSPSLLYTLGRQASIKDLIESLRIPHTEIGCLIVNGTPVDFSYRLKEHDVITALSPLPPVDPCRPDLLRPEPFPDVRFIVDVNVARLGALLRMAGFDCVYVPRLTDAALAETAVRERRILLSRDRNLLKRKILAYGHLVRAHLPDQQLAEIFRLYGLHSTVNPFSRCMICNTLLTPVPKDTILHRLEPLTNEYYTVFFQCRECDRIYWSGSHRSGMDEILAKARR